MTYKVSAVDVGTVKLNEQDTVSSVLQNIAILLSTRQGTVPLYREFGLPMRFLDSATRAGAWQRLRSAPWQYSLKSPHFLSWISWSSSMVAMSTSRPSIIS